MGGFTHTHTHTHWLVAAAFIKHGGVLGKQPLRLSCPPDASGPLTLLLHHPHQRRRPHGSPGGPRSGVVEGWSGGGLKRAESIRPELIKDGRSPAPLAEPTANQRAA